MTPTPDATRALLRADLVRRRDALAAHTHGPKCAPPGLTARELAAKYGVSIAFVFQEQRAMDRPSGGTGS